MKFAVCTFCLLVSTAFEIDAQEALPMSEPPKTRTEKICYCVGFAVGLDIAAGSGPLDLTWLVKGVHDGMNKNVKPLVNDEELDAAVQAYEQQVFTRNLAEMELAATAAASEENKANGIEFLAANAKKEGVVTTKSGLQYQVVKRGTGDSPLATSTVNLRYQGTYLNGNVFESSLERGEPAEFSVNRLIPGLTEAVQLMKVGDKLRLFIPPNLAYGEQGAGKVGPNATLIFDVELLDIVQ